MHHTLAHLEHGALLYKREGARFNFVAFNIACDAIINYVGETLPDVDKLGASIRYGVRRCQEFGIVNWANIVKEMGALAAKTGTTLDPVFTRKPTELGCVDIYYALMRGARQAAASNNENSSDNTDSDEETCSSKTAEDVMDGLAKALDAHDDLSDSIKDYSNQDENEILDQISRAENVLRRVQAEAGSDDAILRVARPDGTTKTPWPRAMRRMASSALLHRPSIDPSRPSRRVISQIALALDPKTPEAIRPKSIIFEPRTSHNIAAKRCVTILDTSGSMFCDPKVIADCIKEISTICKRVNTSQFIIFADADVCEVVDIVDSERKIAELKPKGGGSTDFRPAIALAETLRPDLIVYLTDLMGTFPERKPRAPIIWAFPPSYSQYETPYGQRLPLHP
jgi:predicted metal-dependent peptidase